MLIVLCLVVCKTDFVDAIVDAVVHPGVEVVDVVAEIGGDQGGRTFACFLSFWGEELIEDIDKHAHYVAAFVVDDNV